MSQRGAEAELKIEILISKINNLQISVDNNSTVLCEMKAGLDEIMTSNKAFKKPGF